MVHVPHVSLPIGGHLLQECGQLCRRAKVLGGDECLGRNVPAPEWLAAEHHGHGERRQWVPELFGDVVMANGVLEGQIEEVLLCKRMKNG
jgi:hypothetical protein